MKQAWWFAVVALTVSVTRVDGHQLDELLQSAKLDLSSRRIGIELTLSPGADVAADWIRAVDRDRDSQLSPEELRQFGVELMRDLTLTVDERPIAITLIRAESSSSEEFADGMGALRLVFEAPGSLGPGQHHIRYQNGHAPASSAYLANALKPTDTAIDIRAQRRDYFQRSLEVDVAVAPVPANAAASILLAVAVVLLIVTRGRRRWRALPPLRALR